VKITTDGHKQLGAALGSSNFKVEFITKKVEEWTEEISQLTKVAYTEPQAAYSAFIQGVKHKWTYTMRTVEDISQLLQPLEDCIHQKFIPVLVGQNINENERELIALPPRLGGLGITNPVQVSDMEYENSMKLTAQLQLLIVNQDTDGEVNEEKMKEEKSCIKERRNTHFNDQLEKVKSKLNQEKQKLLEASMEKGASNWLSCLPIAEYGFNLNKQEFRDAIKLRYGWSLTRLPTTCTCGFPFSVHHAMSCKLGGFIHSRHNEVRDITANLLNEVCQDVSIEPVLQPLNGERMHYRTANTREDARLDISARGFWQRGTRAFMDVRVFHPLAPRLAGTTLKQSHHIHESEKRRAYNQRILQVEQGTFTPLVFTTAGGMSNECNRFYSRLATLISEKRGESKASTTTWLRCRISFSLLRSAILCMRGSRTMRPKYEISTSSDLVGQEAQLT
jgi:hypothetical protein